MKTRSLLERLALRTLPLLLVPALTVGCGGCSGTSGDNDDPAGAHGTGADGHDHHDGHDHGTAADRDGLDGATGVRTEVGTDPDRTPLTPVQEREETVKSLEGLRTVLVTELEQVRERLKDGTRPADEKKADTQRAAELAQGLERLDRTIKGINEADDVTWAQVRESSLGAAAEFREWMARYGLAS
ncbi:MAG: hypothetical protein RBT71_07695 [Flavobacteriales bacterium]|nr:hypothetical protein [Flavobacteriales bacterium]